MAHFYLPQTQQKTDFFNLKACTTMKAGLWNVGGPPLFISSDDPGIATVSTAAQYGGTLASGSGMFEFFITGARAGSILLRAKTDTGDQWAFTQAVVSGGDLCINATGSDVQQLQERLNSLDPTRLPRLNPTGRFDVPTKARAMEYQFHQGLVVDGVVGPKTWARLAKAAAAHRIGGAPRGKCVLVDLIHTTLTAYSSGVPVMTVSPVHGGSPDHPSHAGVFPISPTRRLRDHTSSSYPYPAGNMNFSLFYNGPEALHQGPGSLPSKGCIHVSAPYAEQLFNWAGNDDVIVIVVKP